MKVVRSAWFIPVGLFMVTPLHAQQREEADAWVTHAGYMATNALLDGVIAGLIQYFADEGTFADGFAKGALGGSIGYAGKLVAAEQFDGAGFVGREVAALGTSITRNARLGAGLLDEIVFPVGPMRFYWNRTGEPSRIRFDLTALYWIAYGVVEPRLSIDWGKSVSAGAPVFMPRGAEFQEFRGKMAGGSVFLDASLGPLTDTVFAHERIHVLQFDNALGTWGEPFEGWILNLAGRPGRWLAKNFDVGFAPGLGYSLASDLIEAEARFLAGSR